MKSKLKTVYYCDHCKAKRFQKPAIEAHEKYCKSNPENRPACLGCDFLEEYTTYNPSNNNWGNDVKANKFRCQLSGQTMWPPKIGNAVLLHPESFEDEIKMPKECGMKKVSIADDEDWLPF